MSGRPLNTREMSVCLAGLRLLMAWRGDHLVSRDPDLDDNQVLEIACNGDRFQPPDQEFIDNLCVDLNCGEIAVSDGVLEDMARAAAEEPKKRKKRKA